MTDTATTTRRATAILVTTFSASCPCGGGVFAVESGTYQLDGDQTDLACDTCGAAIEITRKTGRL